MSDFLGGYPDIRPFQSFLFCATSGTLLFTGMKRLFLPAVSCLLKKAPDSINTDRQIQRFNDFQTCDIRLFFQKRKDVLMICIGQFWLLSTEIRLSFVAARFVPTLQQTIYRTGIYRKALCQVRRGICCCSGRRMPLKTAGAGRPGVLRFRSDLLRSFCWSRFLP